MRDANQEDADAEEDVVALLRVAVEDEGADQRDENEDGGDGADDYPEQPGLGHK